MLKVPFLPFSASPFNISYEREMEWQKITNMHGKSIENGLLPWSGKRFCKSFRKKVWVPNPIFSDTFALSIKNVQRNMDNRIKNVTNWEIRAKRLYTPRGRKEQYYIIFEKHFPCSRHSPLLPHIILFLLFPHFFGKRP